MVFVLGIAAPAVIVLTVFTTLLLVQEKTSQSTPNEVARGAASRFTSEPPTAPEQDVLDDQRT